MYKRQSIALLSKELNSSPENVFTNQLNYGKIKIGKDRYITLTASDAHAIQKAHDILTEEACNPPTIKALSRMVFLNEQKLKMCIRDRLKCIKLKLRILVKIKFLFVK